MPIFEYQAIQVGGEATNGIVTADSPRQAREQLRGQDVFVTDLKPVEGDSGRTPLWRLPSSLSGRRLRTVALATRQFSTMLGSGMPLTEAISALTEQVEDQRFARVLREVRERVTRGYPLADAMASHPNYFDRLYIGMVRAGEASGHLNEVLGQLAEFCHREYRVRSRVATLMTYPLVVMTVAVGVIIFLLSYVVPTIITIFQDNRLPLPLPTRILIAVSDFLHTWWLALGIGFIGLYPILRAIGETEKGRLVIDSFKLRIPIMGSLFKKQAISRFASTLSALLRSGLPMLDALGIIKEVVGNQVVANSVNEIAESVTAGQDLSAPLKNSDVFPPMVSYMVSTGEQSGQLDVVLGKVADELDEEVDIIGQRLIAFLEPLIILLLASVVAFIVLSIILPMLELSNL